MQESPPTDARMERSLRLLPYWWVLRWAWLGEAIWVVYLVETRGLTIGQVLLFDAVFFASSLLSEVPTGVVADRYGRRISMLSGSLLISGGFLVFALADVLPVLLTAYVLFGIGTALMSGADDAYLFDALRAVGRVREFPAVAGRLNGMMTLAVAGFTIIGGLMATVTPLSWPIVASGILTVAAASLAFRLDEPPRDPGGAADSFFATGLSASRRVLRVPSLRWAATLGALPWVAGFAAFTVWQPVLIGYEVPVGAFGWVAAAMMLIAATGGWSADWFSRRLGMSGVLLLLPVVGAIALLGGSGGLLWFVPLFALAPFAQNALHPISAVYISRRVPDSERATALSLQQFGAQFATIFVMLSLSALVSRIALGHALAGPSALLLAVAVVCWLLWRRAGDRELAPSEDAAA
ncbi:MAG: MFS transporter [Chloroflexi bacterium]|nr:MFS transporter [Chloroflexota bacterium]